MTRTDEVKKVYIDPKTHSFKFRYVERSVNDIVTLPPMRCFFKYSFNIS